MFKILTLVFLLSSLCVFTFAQTVAPRIPNSPYPVSVQPDTLFMVDMDLFPQTQQLTVVTLQGLLAKTRPRIMVTRGTPQFFTDLQDNYGVVYDSTYFDDFTGLIVHFQSEISGYILCNFNDTSTNAGISVCSIYNAVAVNPADSALFDSLGFTMLNNVIAKGQSWAYDTFQSNYSKRILSYQLESKCTYLTDWSVYAGAYHFYDTIPATILCNSAFSNLQTNSAAFGWADELLLVTEASRHGTHVHASDFCNNLTVFSNFTAPTVQKNHSSDTILKPGVHTVCFLMTDGDNLQWLTTSFANSGNNWYGSPLRGACNIGWTLSPALTELGPTQMKYIYDSASTKPDGMDYFVAAPSGMGYIYPDYFQPLDSAADITERMMKKADQSILTIIGFLFDAGLFAPYLAQPDIDAILYFDYNDYYYGYNGATQCVNGKPVISARYDLVAGYFSVDTLAQLLNNQVKDPTSPDGYSLVAVNVWDDGMDSLVACYQQLDSTVRVVTPDAFVKLFEAGTGCNGSSGIPYSPINGMGAEINCTPNPCSVQTNVSFTLPRHAQVQLYIVDAYGRKVKTLLSGLESAGKHQLTLDATTLSAGLYYIILQGEAFSKTVKCTIAK